MLIGGFLMLGVPLVKELILCTFDENSDRLYLEYRNMLFQSDIREEKLDQIKTAKVDKITGSNEREDEDGNCVKTTYVKRYDVKLVLKSGETIPLFSTRLDKEYSFKVATTINEFLDINE